MIGSTRRIPWPTIINVELYDRARRATGRLCSFSCPDVNDNDTVLELEPMIQSAVAFSRASMSLPNKPQLYPSRMLPSNVHRATGTALSSVSFLFSFAKGNLSVVLQKAPSLLVQKAIVSTSPKKQNGELQRRSVNQLSSSISK
jgi:hypothetical protein